MWNIFPRRFNRLTFAFGVTCVALLVACSSDLKTPTAVIAQLGVDGGAAQYAVGTQVTLDGSGSTDPNGEPLAFRWRVAVTPAGSHAAIADIGATTTWLQPDIAGSYTVELVVSDGALTSAPAIATFVAGPCGSATPKITSLTTTPTLPNAGEAVLLQASTSDTIGDTTCPPVALSYAWSIAAVPAGSHASLNDTTLESPSLFTDVPGSYGVQLVVSDAAGHASVPGTVTIVATGCPTTTPEVLSVSASSTAPDSGERVTLNAVVQPLGVAPSSEIDGGAAPQGESDASTTPACDDSAFYVYHWVLESVPPGSAAAIADSALEDPSFVTDVPGTYVAELFVTNLAGRVSNARRITIVAGACGTHAPVVSNVVATSSSPTIGEAVGLSVSATDVDTQAPCSEPADFRYFWTLTALPAGSVARLNDATLAAPSFTPDVAGTYGVSVVAVDPEGHESAPATTTLVARAASTSSCGTSPPVVTGLSASPMAPDTGGVVTLAATISDADTAAPCSLTESFTLAWSLASVPAGSTAALSGTSQTTPWFKADVPGTYVVRVLATDSHGLSSAPKSVTVTATPCGDAAPSVTSIIASPASTTVGSGVSVSAQLADSDTGGTCKLAETFTYAWALTSVPPGSTVTLTSSNTPLTAFVPDEPGTYVVSLVATDSEGHSSAAATQSITATKPSTCGQAVPLARLAGFTVGACSATSCTTATISPAVTSAPNATPPGYSIALGGHASVRLDGSASLDPDNAAPCNAGQTLTYAWAILAAPVGSSAHWDIGAGPTTTLVAPTFVADVPGTYQVALTVSDGTHASSPLVVQLAL